jgi:hypothetical protein
MPTLRQNLAQRLGRGFVSANDLASEFLLRPREVEEHLTHLQRSHKGSFQMRPAECTDCGYIFKKRTRLDAPGRCPACRSQRIEGPWFHLPV